MKRATVLTFMLLLVVSLSLGCGILRDRRTGEGSGGTSSSGLTNPASALNNSNNPANSDIGDPVGGNAPGDGDDPGNPGEGAGNNHGHGGLPGENGENGKDFSGMNHGHGSNPGEKGRGGKAYDGRNHGRGAVPGTGNGDGGRAWGR